MIKNKKNDKNKIRKLIDIDEMIDIKKQIEKMTKVIKEQDSGGWVANS